MKFMEHESFSIGYGDCILDKENRDKNKEIIEKYIKKANDVLMEAYEGVYKPELDRIYVRESIEQEMQTILGGCFVEIQKNTMANIDNDNMFYQIIDSGSKGKKDNLGQILGSVGPQDIWAKRAANGFTDRVLPHFTRFDVGPDAKGFCRNSFSEGMAPNEYYIHAIASRVGVIDTAIKTASSGYISRKFIKATEDISTQYDRTVRNSTDKIIQFNYGNDGLDCIKLEKSIIVLMGFNNDKMREYYQYGDINDDEYLSGFIEEDVVKDILKNKKEIQELVDKEFEYIMSCRDDLRHNHFKHIDVLGQASVYLPVNLYRLIPIIREDFGINDYDLSDLTPKYVIEEVKKLMDDIGNFAMEKELYMRDHFDVYMTFLASKRIIYKYRLNKAAFDFLIEKIKIKIYAAICNPGESVGVVASQTLGEASTQMTLNSIDYNSEVIIKDVNNKIVNCKIGKFIDDYLEKNSEKSIKYPENRTDYIEPNEDYYISAVTMKGDVEWKRIDALTRHLPIGKLIKIKTRSGREVTGTQSHSFLVWNGEELERKKGNELKKGDRVPIICNSSNNINTVDKLDCTEFLPKTEMIYGTEINKITELFKNDKRKRKVGFWKKHLGKTVELPYSYNRPDHIICVINKTKCKNIDFKNGYIYPKHPSGVVSEIPDMIELDREFGFVCGIYLAEGLVTNTYTCISNNNENILNKVKEWCDKMKITYHTVVKTNKRFKNSKSTDLKIHSVIIARLFKRMMNTGSANKYIPNISYNANEDFIIGLLDGYFSGDGTVNKRDGYYVCSSASKKLIIGISNCCSRLGIFGKISNHIIKSNNIGSKNIKPVNTFSIRNDFAKIFAEKIKLTDENKMKRGEDILKRKYNTKYGRHYIKQNDIILDKIVSIEYTEGSKYVYDFTINDLHTFCIDNGLGMSNTFHLSGVGAGSKVVTQGIPRLDEIIRLSKNPKAVVTKIYLKEEYEQDEEAARMISSKLVYIKLVDIIERTEVLYENTEETSHNENMEFLSIYNEFSDMFDTGEAADVCLSNWVLRIIMDKDSLMKYNLTVADIQELIESKKGADELSCSFSDDNSNEVILRINILENVDNNFDYLKDLQASLADMTLSGIKGIKEADPVDLMTIKYNADGSNSEHNIKTIETSGSNLTEILGMDNIDSTRTISNQIIEVYEIFGIEAARNHIMNELNKVYNESSPNPKHIELMADVMTYRGVLMQIDRHGINRKNDCGPIAKAAFEETVNIFVKAAVFAEKDNMQGVSANILAGQFCKVGTNSFDVMLDIDAIENADTNNNGYEYADINKEDMDFDEVENYISNEFQDNIQVSQDAFGFGFGFEGNDSFKLDFELNNDVKINIVDKNNENFSPMEDEQLENIEIDEDNESDDENEDNESDDENLINDSDVNEDETTDEEDDETTDEEDDETTDEETKPLDEEENLIDNNNVNEDETTDEEDDETTDEEDDETTDEEDDETTE